MDRDDSPVRGDGDILKNANNDRQAGSAFKISFLRSQCYSWSSVTRFTTPTRTRDGVNELDIERYNRYAGMGLPARDQNLVPVVAKREDASSEENAAEASTVRDC